MKDFIASVIAWAAVAAIALLLLSGAVSFVRLEWAWITDTPFGRAIAIAVTFWIGTKVEWGKGK